MKVSDKELSWIKESLAVMKNPGMRVSNLSADLNGIKGPKPADFGEHEPIEEDQIVELQVDVTEKPRVSSFYSELTYHSLEELIVSKAKEE